MRELRAIEFMSLDGVIQGPGHPEEDTEGGFRHGGWQREYFDEVLAARAAEGMASTGAYLFGDYCTGEIMLFNNGPEQVLLDTNRNIVGFAEDESGEIYVIGQGGTIPLMSLLQASFPAEVHLGW